MKIIILELLANFLEYLVWEIRDIVANEFMKEDMEKRLNSITNHDPGIEPFEKFLETIP